jgi:uncharacterized protein (TIGR02058 family)
MDNRKRFIVEIGTGVDLHGEDVTKAACRAVENAISRSCLCGLMEIVGVKDPGAVEVEIVVASPKPDQVDLDRVKAAAPVGRKTARSVLGGMTATGLCVPRFGENCDQIMVANAAITVYVKQ